MAELGRGAAARLAYELGEDADGSPVVKLQGELDMTTSPALEAAVAPILSTRPQHLVIDARGLEFADRSAIALLVRWANVVPQVDIRHPSELLRRVIARMGLSTRLRVEE